MIKIFSSQFALGCLCLILCGCSGMDFLSPTWTRDDFTIADEKNPAVKMLCAWQPVEGTGLDGMPTRGFAGQILFFNRQDAEPVAVEGDVRIILFDDVGTLSEQAKPIRLFEFKGQAWNVHAHQTTLGPSYNIFIPYTRENYHYLTNCSLRVRLIPKSGPTIFSNVANVPLPGPKRPDDQRTASNDSAFGKYLLQTGQQGTTNSIGGKVSGDSNVNRNRSDGADLKFQTRKQKMQHVEQMVKQYMNSPQSPARTNRATSHLPTTETPHRLSQPSQMNSFSDSRRGLVPTGPVASVTHSSGSSHQMSADGQVQPITTEINAVRNQFDYYQTENHPQAIQKHPIQQGHPLQSGFNPASQSIHPLAPTRNASPTQQSNRLPTTSPSHPVLNPEQRSSRMHPLGQPRQHPLEGFSSQYVPVEGQSRLQPTVQANAAPLRQVNSPNFKLRRSTNDSITFENASIDRRLSFVGR